MKIIRNNLGTSVTTLVLFCGSALGNEEIEFDKNFEFPQSTPNYLAPINLDYDCYDIASYKHTPSINHEEILLNFASSIIDHLTDMPIEFSKAVDESFWDLL